jgi:hypothetical protein
MFAAIATPLKAAGGSLSSCQKKNGGGAGWHRRRS